MPVTETLILSAFAAGGTVLLVLLQSLRALSRTGPQVRAEVSAHYRFYLVYAILRQAFWAFAVTWFWVLLGVEIGLALSDLQNLAPSGPALALAGLTLLSLAAGLSFCRRLLEKPGFICASWQYRISRLYPLWGMLSPGRLKLATALLSGLAGLPLAAGLVQSALSSDWGRFGLRGGLGLALILFLVQERRERTMPTPAVVPKPPQFPNIVMLGCDTLRVDHLGVAGYGRNTSPYIDRLCQEAILFRNCYAPLARTAPSLASLLGSVWPHRHGIRDNLTLPSEARIPENSLPRILNRHGYRTRALADWCGSDLRKFDFGFEKVEAPPDQWNIKYYLRQGPMLMRLFLSLFFDNFMGRMLLPEVYYVCGNPLETPLAVRACRAIAELAHTGQPFFLNVFMAGTHAPFGSEFPHYLDFADRDYQGNAKFVMTTFADPNDIVQKQEQTRDHFDLDQILNLYDGCVRKFDREVERIRAYLEESGLLEHTLLVIYSDHGIEFFENQSWGQGNTVLGDDFSAKVPLIIKAPGMPGGQTLDAIVRTVDLVPTLLELCGIATPLGVDGQSLMPMLRDGVEQDLPAYQETGYWLGSIPGRHPDHLSYPTLLDLLEIPDKRAGTMSIRPEMLRFMNRAKDRMLRRGRWKLIYQPLKDRVLWQLFDMVEDPGCVKDLAGEHPAIYAALRNEMTEWLRADGIED